MTSKKIYAAPMEGITGYVFRQAHAACYPGIDQYYTPFLTPNQHHCFSTREQREILPERNAGLTVIPQLLTNSAENFCWAVRELRGLGYREINLNLGCPSKTVVTKKKGSGGLSDPFWLAQFLDDIFSSPYLSEGTDPAAEISIKTRLGIADPAEFLAILDIYNRFPVKELTIHPRTGQEFYGGSVHLDLFAEAMSRSKNPICYNGNLFSPEDASLLWERFPQVPAIMLGRGLIANPALAGQIANPAQALQTRAAEHQQRASETASSNDLVTFRRFHDLLFAGYTTMLSGQKNVLIRMKELWALMIYQFPGADRELKQLQKSRTFSEYEAAVGELFASGTYTPKGYFVSKN